MNKWIAALLLTAATSVATVSMAAPVAPAKPAPHVSKPVQHVQKKSVKKPVAKKQVVKKHSAKKPVSHKHVTQKPVPHQAHWCSIINKRPVNVLQAACLFKNTHLAQAAKPYQNL